MLCKHALAAESNSPVYQLKDYVFALLADCRYVFHLDDEFAATKVYPCLSQALLSSAAQGAMSFPSTITRRCLALSTTEILSIASPTRGKARRTPNPASRKSLNLKESNARARSIKVEEVESVENVDATRRAGD